MSSRPEIIFDTDTELDFAGIVFITDTDFGLFRHISWNDFRRKGPQRGEARSCGITSASTSS